MAPASLRPTSFGLALGGGAALGYAHVGVLAALTEAGLHPSAYAGTSAGAVVAAMAAFGVEPEALRQRLGALGWRGVADPSRSLLGALTNEDLGHWVTSVLGPAQIEDAAKPLAIVTTDIETGERIVLREGPLTLAIRASTAVPGVFVPVRIGARLLADGGLVENVPVRPLREIGLRSVVGVNVVGRPPHACVETATQALTNAAFIALHSGTHREPPDGADVLIEPDLAGRSAWSTRDLPGLWEIGHAAGQDAVPRVRAHLAPADGAALG